MPLNVINEERKRERERERERERRKREEEVKEKKWKEKRRIKRIKQENAYIDNLEKFSMKIFS